LGLLTMEFTRDTEKTQNQFINVISSMLIRVFCGKYILYSRFLFIYILTYYME